MHSFKYARPLFLVLFVLCALKGEVRAEVSDYTLVDQGLTRHYILNHPQSLAATSAAPLVIVLHGGFGTGAQAERSYDWDAAAQAHGFNVAYPDGYRRSWNAGGSCCGQAARENIDDVEFLTLMIAQIEKTLKVDPKRIYMTGMSNGAVMSYRYACEGTVPLAAIGSVSGTMMVPCRSVRPSSVMEIHGLLDQHIPYAGGPGQKSRVAVDWAPVEKGVDYFMQIDKCQPLAPVALGAMQRKDTTCADNRTVSLITISDAGHQWPGSQARSRLISDMLGMDQPSNALDATQTLWAFFEAHPLP